MGVVVPAGASTITMDFSGTVIIDSSNYNFSGSLTWDPAAIPTDPPVNSQFNADGVTFIFDSTDLTADIGSPTIQLAAPADFLFHFDLGGAERHLSAGNCAACYRLRRGRDLLF